jgi:hypothetical protein
MFVGCPDNGQSRQPPNVVYAGKISVTQGVNGVNTAGPIRDSLALTLSAENQGTELMLVSDVVGRIISNDDTLTVNIRVVLEKAGGLTDELLMPGVRVNTITTLDFVDQVVSPGQAMIIKIYLTSPAAGTADTIQFSGLEVNSSGGRAVPHPGPPTGQWIGPVFLAG